MMHRERGTSVEPGLVLALSLKISKLMVYLMQLVVVLVEALFGPSPNCLLSGSLLGVLRGYSKEDSEGNQERFSHLNSFSGRQPSCLDFVYVV